MASDPQSATRLITCPEPSCGKTLRLKAQPTPGRILRCPSCGCVVHSAEGIATSPDQLGVPTIDVPPPQQVSEAATLPPAPALPPNPDDSQRTTDHAPADEYPTLPPAESDAAAAPAEQTLVAGYEILGELGRGGMGVVYKARDVKLNRLVALKMILAGGHAGEAELARFRREAEAVAQLQHPHIVQIHEIGEQDGLPYFALEFVAGGSLADRLDGTPLPQQQAAQLVEVLARAMHAAHERGIVHRDLKPPNVLLTTDGAPKVTDFGLAKRLDMEGQTQSGAILGTPSYMAPEQAAGDSKKIGPAADIYALGAILYELLTGRPPFKAATSLDTILQVVSNEPVAPRQLQPQTARDLDTICLKCLSKEPRKRYASAEALADDLRCFHAGEPIAARPVGRLERGWRWCQRNKAVASLLAVVALTLVAATAVAWWLALVTRTEKSSAEKALQRAQQNLVTSQLLRVGLLFENHPDAALALLHDQDTIPVGLRDAAWGFYHSYCRRKVRTLTGHKGAITSVAWGGDGTMLASASLDGTIKLWDVATRQQHATLTGHTGVVWAVAWSADGRTLASASADRTIKLWDVATCQKRVSLTGHNGPVRAVAWSGDGTTLASASEDRTIKLWDVAAHQERASLMGHDGPVAAVAWNRDGTTLVSASQDKTIKLWDVATRQERATLTGHTSTVAAVALSGDGTTLASASYDKTIKLWDVATHHERDTLKGHNAFLVNSVAWSADGKTLASASQDQTIKLWDVATRQERASLQGHKLPVSAVAWSADGRTLASASSDRTIKLWDVATRQERASLQGHRAAVFSVAWSRDGKTLASASGDGTIKLWDLATRQQRATLQGHRGIVNAVAWSTDGTMLASAGNDGTIKLWDVATNQKRGSLQGHNGIVYSVAWSGDSKMLASASQDQTIKLWDIATCQKLASLTGHNLLVHAVAWSADSRTLASASPDGTIKLWDVATGQERASLTGHNDLVNAVAWSADGTMLASAGNDGTIKLWDVDTAGGRDPQGSRRAADQR
jgi:WD40 repeat protein/tRNA A-37 threonylcarbamoyl transferase component Bud32